MIAKTTVAADEGSHSMSSQTEEQERKDGAWECVRALMILQKSAENIPCEADDVAAFFSIQSDAAKALFEVFAPMTPRQEGAFRVLAEYAYENMTGGGPDLDMWRPIVALTEDELDSMIAEFRAAA